jgi:hypothetical protein
MYLSPLQTTDTPISSPLQSKDTPLLEQMLHYGFEQGEVLPILERFPFHPETETDTKYIKIKNYLQKIQKLSNKEKDDLLEGIYNQLRYNKVLSHLLQINSIQASNTDEFIHKLILKGYKIEKGIDGKYPSIGSGAFGSVYPGKLIEGSKESVWAIKIDKGDTFRLDNSNQMNELLTEMAYYYLFSKESIGPKLPPLNKAFFIETTTNRYCIITQMYQRDLADYLKSLTIKEYDNIRPQLEQKLLQLIDKMLTLGVICTDMKPENVLINDINDIRLTDFGGDWCCNSKIQPICQQFKENKGFLEKGNHRLYILYIILFCFASYTRLYLKKIVFNEKMKALDTLLMNDHFIEFLNHFCDKKPTCEDLPPFYYVNRFLRRLNLPKNKFIKLDLDLSKLIQDNHPLYILKAYFILFPPQ